jgi:hypothetical protein
MNYDEIYYFSSTRSREPELKLANTSFGSRQKFRLIAAPVLITSPCNKYEEQFIFSASFPWHVTYFQLGGNAKALAFFRAQNCNTNDAQVLPSFCQVAYNIQLGFHFPFLHTSCRLSVYIPVEIIFVTQFRALI